MRLILILLLEQQKKLKTSLGESEATQKKYEQDLLLRQNQKQDHTSQLASCREKTQVYQRDIALLNQQQSYQSEQLQQLQHEQSGLESLIQREKVVLENLLEQSKKLDKSTPNESYRHGLNEQREQLQESLKKAQQEVQQLIDKRHSMAVAIETSSHKQQHGQQVSMEGRRGGRAKARH